jgi:putative addiction module killer protein
MPIEILKTAVFDRWLSGIQDGVARTKIQVRIDRLALGKPGDVEPVGNGVSELRIHHGAGYRVYSSSEAWWL